MICIQNKRGTGRAILLTLFLAFLLPAGAAPAQAAGGTSVSMDGKDVNSSTVVVLPKDAAVAFSLKLNGTYGKGYTSGNGTVRLSKWKMEAGGRAANNGTVYIMPMGKIPARQWTYIISIHVPNAGHPPKCKPGLHTGGSAMVHVGNVISFPQNTG